MLGAAPASKAAVAPLPREKGKPVRAAFVLGPKFTVIDFAGPWEAFADVMVDDTPSGFGFEMAMLSDSTAPITEAGFTVLPQYTYASYPGRPNVIVIGAQGDYTPAKIAWIQSAAQHADLVMSVCRGAFLLAQTGLLDGLSATTHHTAFASFEKKFPKVRLVRGRRFVDNGKIATSAGESSGIELALHVVSRYYGAAAAADAADTMEYRSA